MTQATSPTLDELLIQQAALNQQIAIASVAGAQVIQAIMARAATTKLADDLAAALAAVPPGSTVHEQAGNVVNVVRQVINLINGEVTRLQALAGQPAPQG